MGSPVVASDNYQVMLTVMCKKDFILSKHMFEVSPISPETGM